MTETDYILSARDIYREFPTTNSPLAVLKGANLDILPHQTAAVTGESGVGKSTLLHILGGLDKPNKGDVIIGGERLTDKSEKSLAKFRNEKIGFVFQFHYLLEDFTAVENVMIPMLVAGQKKSDAMINAEHLLDLVGLKDRKDHRPNQLSGGEQQRVAVARALANSPELVIADEPSGNLDIKTGRKLHDLMLKLNKENGITFLIATHNMELAQECERHFNIEDGVIHEF